MELSPERVEMLRQYIIRPGLLDTGPHAPTLVVSDRCPPGEVWVVERLSPLEEIAGFKPRVLGKIVNIGEDLPQ